MPTYATYQDLIAALDQFKNAEAPPYEALLDTLERATSIINLELGLDDNLTPAASGVQTIYGDGTAYLTLPPHTGLATLVTAPSGYTVPAYRELDGFLVVTNSAGIVGQPVAYGLSQSWAWASAGVWVQGVPYAVTASWGGSVDTMRALALANVEIAVSLWNFKDAGGYQAVGTDAAVRIVRNQFSPMVRSILDGIAGKRRGVGVH